MVNLEGFVLVFCNGELPARRRIDKLLPHPRLIACADGGANKAFSLGYEPNVVIGDLDSFDDRDKTKSNLEIIKIGSQDNTDFEKTLDVLLGRGFKNFLIVAFSGGRIDQTLANLQIAYEYSSRCKLVLADDQYLIFPARESFGLDVLHDTGVSLISMEDGTHVSTSGLKYELDHAFLKKGGQGISNKATKTRMELTIHEGGVLVFLHDAGKGEVIQT